MRRKIVALVAFCSAAAASALAWSRLPERAPVHWNLHGQPDRYGSRLELVVLGPVLVLGTWLLLELVRVIDPRVGRTASQAAATQRDEGARGIVECVLIAMMLVLHVTILLSATGTLREPVRLVAVLLGALLVVVGNFLGRVRPNWFIGIRTPWTLSSDEVWRRTHRLGARVAVVCGLVLVPLAISLPQALAIVAALAVVLAAGLVPAAWSYVLWHRSNPTAPASGGIEPRSRDRV